MSIPIINTLIQSQSQFIQVLKTLTFERQRAELLPPGFNQVQPTGILGQEHDLNVGPGRQRQSDLPTSMNAQIIFNEQPTVGRKACDHHLQQLDMTGAVPPWAQQNGCFSRGWFKQPMHPQLAPASIVWLKRSSVWPQLPFFPWVGLDGNRSHFIQAQRTSVRQRGDISGYDAPLFSTNSGSCLAASRNQLSWRFHSNPSASNHSQMVESDKWVWLRSSKARCSRSSVHSLKGYPKVFGFCVASAINALRTSGLWVGCRPGRDKRKTNVPSRQPSSSVSRIAWRLR